MGECQKQKQKKHGGLCSQVETKVTMGNCSCIKGHGRDLPRFLREGVGTVHSGTTRRGREKQSHKEEAGEIFQARVERDDLRGNYEEAKCQGVRLLEGV